MPGQRKKGKNSIGFYWKDIDIDLLKEGSKMAGVSMSTFVKYLVHEQAKTHKVDTTALRAIVDQEKADSEPRTPSAPRRRSKTTKVKAKGDAQ